MNNEVENIKDLFLSLKMKGVGYFSKDLITILSECDNPIITKGPYINIRPFEIERSGFKIGKLLKKEPAKIKNIYKYYIDKFDRVRLIEILDGKLGDKEIYIYNPNEIVSFFFDAAGDIRNIRKSFVDGCVFIKEINYGKFGFSISDYEYENDLVVSINVFEKEHQDVKGATYNVEFKYNNGELTSIVNVFPNGYEEQRYP